MTGNGFGDGWDSARWAIVAATSTASRYRSNRSLALLRSAISRSAWRAFSRRLRRSTSAASASARRSRAPDRVSRSRSSWASASSPASTDAVDDATAPSATLRRPGFLSPLVVSSWSARSSFFFARPVPRSAPLMDACSRSRSAVSSRARSLSSWWRTDAVERKNGSVGIPVSSAMTWSASVGSVTVCPSYWSLTVPFWPAKDFSSVPVASRPSSSSCSNSSAIHGLVSVATSHGRRASRSAAVLVTRRVMASSIARWIVDLPASLGPRITVTPGASSTSRSW